MGEPRMVRRMPSTTNKLSMGKALPAGRSCALAFLVVCCAMAPDLAAGSEYLDMYPTVSPLSHAQPPKEQGVDQAASEELESLYPTVSPFTHAKADELLAIPTNEFAQAAAARQKKKEKIKKQRKPKEAIEEEKYEFATGAIPDIPSTETAKAQISPPAVDLAAAPTIDDQKDTEFIENMIAKSDAHVQKVAEEEAAIVKKHSPPEQDKFMLRHYQLAEVGYDAVQAPPATELMEVVDQTNPKPNTQEVAMPHTHKMLKPPRVVEQAKRKRVQQVPTLKKKKEKHQQQVHLYQPMRRAQNAGEAAHAAMHEMSLAAASAASVVKEAHEMIKKLRIEADVAHDKWSQKVKKDFRKMHKLKVRTAQKPAKTKAVQIAMLQEAQEAEEHASFAHKPKAYQKHVVKYCRKKYPKFVGDPAFRTRHGQLKDPRGPDWAGLCKKTLCASPP